MYGALDHGPLTLGAFLTQFEFWCQSDDEIFLGWQICGTHSCMPLSTQGLWYCVCLLSISCTQGLPKASVGFVLISQDFNSRFFYLQQLLCFHRFSCSVYIHYITQAFCTLVPCVVVGWRVGIVLMTLSFSVHSCEAAPPDVPHSLPRCFWLYQNCISQRGNKSVLPQLHDAAQHEYSLSSGSLCLVWVSPGYLQQLETVQSPLSHAVWCGGWGPGVCHHHTPWRSQDPPEHSWTEAQWDKGEADTRNDQCIDKNLQSAGDFWIL